MSVLSARFAYATDQAGFWKKGIKPAIQPYIDFFKDDEMVGNPKNAALRLISPFRVVGGVIASSARFGYHLAKGPE